MCSFFLSGGQLNFVSELKYLGVYLVAAKCFKTSVSHLKVKFYRVLTVFMLTLKLLTLRLLLLNLLRHTVCPFYCMRLNLFYSLKASCMT